MTGRPGGRWREGLLLPGLLVVAMTSATFTVNSVAVLAPHLLPAFGIGRGLLGLVATVSTVTGALISPAAGRLVDRIGARWSMVTVFATAASAYGMFAVAPHYAVMLLGGLAAAVALAVVNPATNTAVIRWLPPGRRATVTGIKQAGPSLGFFAGAFVLPPAAAVLGWRETLAVVGLVVVAAVPIAWRALPQEQASPVVGAAGEADKRELPGLTGTLALYALLLGFANSTVYLLPLYTVEELGVRAEVAGFAAGLAGFTGIVGRILWARTVEARGQLERALQMLAVGAAAAYGAIMLSPYVGGWLLLGAAGLVIGLTASSWQPIAVLALMRDASESVLGAASGRVMMGFYLGLGIGPPVFGILVDTSGSYVGVWLLSMAAAVLGCVLVRRYQARNPSRPVDLATAVSPSS